jgi:hypothetical protein
VSNEDIRAAMISGMGTIEDLQPEDLSNANEWQVWRLGIVDASGQTVQSTSLDLSSSP